MPAKRALPILIAILIAIVACTPSVPHDLAIVATDFTFQTPETVPAGPVLIHFRNAGKVPHELNVRQLKPETTTEQIAATMRSGAGVSALGDPDVAVLFAEPGAGNHWTIALDLRRGQRYLLLCGFSDSTGAPRHMQMGMFKTIAVR